MNQYPMIINLIVVSASHPLVILTLDEAVAHISYTVCAPYVLRYSSLPEWRADSRLPRCAQLIRDPAVPRVVVIAVPRSRQPRTADGNIHRNAFSSERNEFRVRQYRDAGRRLAGLQFVTIIEQFVFSDCRHTRGEDCTRDRRCLFGVSTSFLRDTSSVDPFISRYNSKSQLRERCDGPSFVCTILTITGGFARNVVDFALARALLTRVNCIFVADIEFAFLPRSKSVYLWLLYFTLVLVFFMPYLILSCFLDQQNINTYTGLRSILLPKDY
ncbi:hypothetical protein J6590_063260 [Homalodisca vitripennis]|nr:hypothetical protein J6590_063260 [Homalodisca vitripennis]